MVGESTRTLRGWLDHIWCKYLTNADGTPKVKVHGFGMTMRELIVSLPVASVNSTSWIFVTLLAAATSTSAADGTVRDYKIEFSSRSGKRYKAGRGITSGYRRRIRKRFRTASRNWRPPGSRTRNSKPSGRTKFGYQPG